MSQFAFNRLSLALMMALTTPLLSAAATESDKNTSLQEQDVEVVSVLGKRVSYANNSTDDQMKQAMAPIGNVMNLIDNLPGINVGQGDAFGSDDYTTTISMRGFVIDRADQQLGITIDGIPNGGSAYAGGSKANRYLDVENTRFIEVGQGSADIASASLDALGGTINFVSADPHMDSTARFAYTSGSYNARRYFARVDSGELFGHTSAYLSVSDSFNNRWIGTGSNGHADRFHVEFKSVTELDKGRITTRFSYDDAHEDNYDYRSLAQFKQNPRWDGLTNAWTGDPDIDQNFAEAWSTLRENSLLYVKTEWFLTDTLDLTITPYLHLQNGRGDWLPPYQVFATDVAGNRINQGNGSNRITYTHVDANGQPILDGNNQQDGSKRVSSYRHTHYDKTRYGATANLSWELGEHRLRTGVWLESQQRNQTRDWHAVLDPQIYHYFDEQAYWVQFNDDYDNKVLKYYLQDQLQLGDVNLTLGLQQYRIETRRTDLFQPANNGKVSNTSSLLPSVGLIYTLNPSLEVFSGYSKNFKAIPDTILNTVGQNFSELKPETADNIELGLRYFGNSISAALTLYQIKFNNRITLLTYQELDGAPDYLTELDGTFINIGGVNSNGMEATIDWRLAAGLSWRSALTLNNSEYTENINGYRKGDKVAAIPETMLSTSLNYQLDNYRAGLSAKYTGSYFGAAKRLDAASGSLWNRDSIPAHTIINANFGYHVPLSSNSNFSALEINLVLNNLTNKAYITGGQEGAYLLGAGRSSSLTLSLSF
ncbi:TonB-dependent receptor domain-containing protein [Arsukibacterium sp.]|uniref:TonB-dependent receptor domain-containing protein n=1 Tax=Arsukibacterium sp. TaxID=1977258 RepID=UPI002FDB461B